MKNLTREDILSADDLVTVPVEVPEWGGVVYVRTMTGAERDEFEAGLVEIKSQGKEVKSTINTQNVRARLIAVTIVDDSGERIFSAEDVEKLGQKSAAAVDRVFTVAQELNGLTEDDVKELEGN